MWRTNRLVDPKWLLGERPSPVVLEERERVVVQDLNGGHRHLAGVNKDPEESAILSA